VRVTPGMIRGAKTRCALPGVIRRRRGARYPRRQGSRADFSSASSSRARCVARSSTSFDGIPALALLRTVAMVPTTNPTTRTVTMMAINMNSPNAPVTGVGLIVDGGTPQVQSLR
jgi:hypothetical protein